MSILVKVICYPAGSRYQGQQIIWDKGAEISVKCMQKQFHSHCKKVSKADIALIYFILFTVHSNTQKFRISFIL